ncbi:Splicing factor [Puccinia graminis f. sp. tritici]|uniref:U4/U6 snRNA-associated-splicing factor PRP24 n=1 Tax=Puccinia graminis f. sp. tritici TaxID=56615 RepID=A0A5B0QIM7_PUCGR|nr:Splicing factor [Puccinia graminis f. sp. tritici]
MAEVEMENAEVPPPDTDEDSPDQILNQLLEVMSALQTNPFDYSLHERNVALCQKLGAGTIEELNQARTLMSEYFPVKEDFFTDWVSDVVSSHQSPYEVDCVQKVLEIYEQASSYSFFFKIETTRLRYMIDLFYYARGLPPPAGEVIERIAESSEIDTKDPDHVTERTEEQIALESFISEERLRTLAIDVMDKTGYHLLESSAIWNMWAIHEFDNLKRNWNTDGLAQFKNMVQARLRIPHTDSPKTFQMYSNLITKYENNNYEEEMVAVNTLYSPARKLMEDREAHEAQLKKSGYSCQEYLKYISWEISRKPSHFDLAQMLFERALADHPNSVELWLEFLRYLNHHRDQHALSAAIVKRATRTVPWSGEIWACAIRTFERNNQTIEAVEGLCARAIQSKFLEHDIEALISFTIGRADFHRRRLDAYIVAGGNENAEQVKSLIDMVANVLHHGIDTTKKVLAKTGDPSCRLEKYLATFFEHHDREDDAAKVWQKATKQYRNASSPWISAAECEARRGDLTRAREYYKKSSNIKLDYPEYLLEAWLTFEHHFGALDDLEYAISKVNNLMKGISARRKREAEQNSETLAQNSSLDNTVGDDAGGRAPAETDENSETRKRKAETIAETKGGDKKIKLNTLPTEATTSTNAGEAPELKRDRENSTVLVAGLTPETSEAKISQLFRDCGRIREIAIHKISSEDVVATVEFEDRASVLPAQTKDKKLLDGVEVAVSLAWRSTLYVTNFPEDANDEWIRSKFSQFGSIFDVRWPSKRFKSTRRFCYIQFTSPASAEAALQLHNLEVSPKQKMSVLISDPTRKQTRSDNHANDKELYITCLSKYVQEDDLRKLFAQFGEIKGVRVVLDQAGHSKGFAFVEYQNEMSAKAALSMNNVELKKRRIGVTISSAKGLSLARKNTSFKDETKLSSATDHRSRSVRVSNIAEGTQEALIQQAFEQFGKVLKTITYPEKSEALVEFALEKDAGRVFLHKEPIVINDQKVEVSVPTATLKSGMAASSSFTPLLPRSTVKGKKSRIGLGHSGARPSPKPQTTKEEVRPDPKQAGSANDVQMADQSHSNSSAKAGSKTQDDFRKMLG